MVALVTDSEVKALVDTDRDTTPFITVAHLIIAEDMANSGLSTDRLTQIELYLAAHFTALTEERGGIVGSKVGDAEERVANNYGQGLTLTRFGQTAISLDTTGVLAQLATIRKKAQFSTIQQYERPATDETV